MKKQLLFCISVLLLASFAMAQRLPEIAAPENYKLTLTPDFDKNNFTGEEVVGIRVSKATSQIVLNSADIEISEATIVSGGDTQTPTVTFDKEKEMVTFAVRQELQPGSVMLKLKYVGILNDQLRGFYLGKDAQGHKYAVTQFEATDARRAFPCFDEPDFKATFDISVVADKGLIAIANTKMISDLPGPGEKHTVRFATSQKMSSYLAAIAVGNFEYVEGEAEGIPIRIYSMPGKKQLGMFALQATQYFLKYFNHYFGIKYPYGKLDLDRIARFFRRCDGKCRFHHFARGSICRWMNDCVPGAAEDGGYRDDSRDRAPMVWRSGHHEMVGRRLAQRGLRHLDGRQDRWTRGSRTGMPVSTKSAVATCLPPWARSTSIRWPAPAPSISQWRLRDRFRNCSMASLTARLRRCCA